jgi:endo-1,4-beta-D-glucanase Y
MIAVFTLVAVSGPEHSGDAWPLWRAYVAHFVNADGRVIDRTNGDDTTSAIRTNKLGAMLYGAQSAYYDQSLVIFGQGLTKGRYHFAVDGSLYLRWESQCISQ